MPNSKLIKVAQEAANFKGRIGERTVVFFDAVMAIAITLMVLEIGIPEAEGFELEQLQQMFVPFTALCVSFVALGQLWYLHSQVYASESMVHGISVPAHLVLMFLVVLFPKTTELLSEYPTSPYAIILYLVCYILLVAVQFGTIIVSYRKQSARFNRMLKQRYGFTLNKHSLAQVGKQNAWAADLMGEISDVTHSIIADVILAIITTFGAVFALFLNPAVCYVFFVIEMAGSAIISRHAEGHWEDIGAAWARLDGMSEDDQEPVQAQ